MNTELPCLGTPKLCHSCSSGAEQVILDLPRDYWLLSSAIARTAGTADGPTSANKPKSTPPINLLIDAVRTRLVYSAALWEEILRDHCQLSTRRAGTVRQRWSIVQSVRILAPRVELLAALPHTDGYFDGVECGLVRRNGLEGLRSLVRLHDGVQRILGYTPVIVRLPGLCSCGGQRLRREVGSETVDCPDCGGRWTYAEYTANVRLSVTIAQDRPLTTRLV